MLSQDINAIALWLERRSANGTLGPAEVASGVDRLRTIATDVAQFEAEAHPSRPVVLAFPPVPPVVALPAEGGFNGR